MPSVFTLRNKYLPKIYEESFEKFKQIVAGQFLWASIDETTDSEQRYVANFVFVVLGVERKYGRCYLFALKVLEAVNSSTTATFFDECINELVSINAMRKYYLAFRVPFEQRCREVQIFTLFD